MIIPGKEFYKDLEKGKSLSSAKNTLRGGNPREGYPLRRPRQESFDSTWLRSNPQRLVALCRLQAADTPLVVTIRRRKINHVVRTGLRPIFLFVDNEEKPETKKNRRFTKRFKHWAKRADRKGKLSFARLQRLVRNELFSSGEVFVKKIIDRSDPARSPLKLQLVDRDQIDRSKAGKTDNGGYIRRGIEYNPNGEEIAYWIFKRYPGEILTGINESTRLPAEWMLHVFDPERVTQYEGVPEASATVSTNGDLEDYLGAALQQARSDALNYGILTGGSAADLQAFNSPNSSACPVPDSSGNWPVDWESDGSLTNETVINMDGGGRITVLPEGKFEAPNPNTPNSNLPQFAAAQSRRAALPVGTSYELATGDFTQTSFSGAMASKQDTAVDFECDQFVFIEEFCEKIMDWYLESEWLYGPEDIKQALSGYGLDPDQYNLAVSWQYNGEQTLNPLQHANAAAKKIELGMSSHRTEAAALGENFDDNMDNQLEELDLLIAREKKRVELLRLTEERTALETGKDG